MTQVQCALTESSAAGANDGDVGKDQKVLPCLTNVATCWVFHTSNTCVNIMEVTATMCTTKR